MATQFRESLLVIIGLLTFATLLVFVLSRFNPENRTLKNVKTIVRSWWVIVAVVTGALALGKFALLFLFFFLSLLIINEYLKKSRYGHDRRIYLFCILSGVCVFQYGTLFYHADRMFLIAIPLLILVVSPLMVILTNSVENLPLAFAATIGLMLLDYYLSHIPALAFSDKIRWEFPEQPLIAVLILIFFTECNDIFQFLCGKLFGKHKIVPHVSPNKTEMGFLGGIICTSAASAFVMPPLIQISRGQAAGLGLAISIFGIFGDLFFSAVKRHLSIKDFSHALPGHGGIIDRLDSLIFTAPIFFHLLTYWKGVP